MRRHITLFLSIVLITTTLSARSAPKKEEALPLEDLQRFTSVIEHIRNYYVKPAEDQLLFENAIRGMLAGLDPHSAYLDAEEFADLQVNTSGKFGGLGIEVTMEEGFIRIISPIDDTPATKANIEAGDLIIKIDETSVKGLTLRQSVELMRGEKGTDITLTILREGAEQPLPITLTRDIIEVRSVKNKMLEPGFGYVRISQFQAKTGSEVIKAVKKLQKETENKQLNGLVLDLRNNPGGLLEASVQVSDAFLSGGPLQYDNMIVYTESRLPGSEMKEKATRGDVLNGAPIVVLVNGGSASASEIVSGALQDHHRAVILGTRTFGKGSVQTILPLNDTQGLKLTTALYFTPKGRSIQATGIEPDILVKNLKIDDTDNTKGWLGLRESDLQGHLQSTLKKEKNESVTTEEKNNVDSEIEPEAPLVTTDYQLHEALSLLKGLSILKGHKN